MCFFLILDKKENIAFSSNTYYINIKIETWKLKQNSFLSFKLDFLFTDHLISQLIINKW